MIRETVWYRGVLLGVPAGADDVGWEGIWEPMLVKEGTMNELKNLAGMPVRRGSDGTGSPYEWCAVNMRTNEFRYPVPTPPSGGPS